MLRKKATYSFGKGILLPTDLTRKTASAIASDVGLPVDFLIPGKLLLTTRAISNRTNDNGDFFGADQLKGEFDGRTAGNEEYGFQTFVGKPVFLDHNNTQYDDPRGRMIASALFEDEWNDKTAATFPRLDFTEHEATDTWVKVWHEIDADRYPLTAMAVERGIIKSTSMGCDVEYSVCSVCDKTAHLIYDYCDHIASHKMRKKFAREDGIERIAYERNYGITFFEDSLLTVPPADPTADILQVGTGVFANSELRAIASEKAAGDYSEYQRGKDENVDNWMERRRELAKAAFRTQVSFAGATALEKVARRNDVPVTGINRRTILATPNKKVLASAKTEQFALHVEASSPKTIWITDNNSKRVAFYGTHETPTAATLEREFHAADFPAYARAVFARQDSLARARRVADAGEAENQVHEEAHTSDDGGASTDGGETDNAETVEDHVPANTDAEPAAVSTDKGDSVQDALPGEGKGSAENAEAPTAEADPVKMAAAILAKHVREGGELPDFLKKDDSADDDADDDKGGDGDGDDDSGKPFPGAAAPFGGGDDDKKEAKMDRSAAARRRAAALAARRRQADGLDEATPEDKGMAEPLAAPTDEIDIEKDKPDAAVTPEAVPSVEDEGIQRPMSKKQFDALVNRRVATQANKIWDALELTSHKIRLGRATPDRLLVESRRAFDTMSHSDIRAQISALADLAPVQAARQGTPTLNRPVTSKIARQRQEQVTGETAFAASLI